MPIGEGIDAKIVAESSGSRASHEKPAGAATNTITNSYTTKMSSTLDDVPVPPHKPPRYFSLRPSRSQRL